MITAPPPLRAPLLQPAPRVRGSHHVELEGKRASSPFCSCESASRGKDASCDLALDSYPRALRKE